jgi:hypothetical protein
MNKESIVDKINQIKSELSQLAERVRKLPPNPNVAQLGKNCISINSSELFKHDIWTPGYYIFSDQYNTIAQLIETLPIDEVLNKLNRIVKTKRYYLKGNTIMFHPQVIENLKTIIK